MAVRLVGAVTPAAARLLAGIRAAAHETGERAMAKLLHAPCDSKEEAVELPRRIVLVILSISVSLMVVGCTKVKNTPTSATPTPATTMTKLTVTGLTALTALGQTTQLTA